MGGNAGIWMGTTIGGTHVSLNHDHGRNISAWRLSISKTFWVKLMKMPDHGEKMQSSHVFSSGTLQSRVGVSSNMCISIHKYLYAEISEISFIYTSWILSLTTPHVPPPSPNCSNLFTYMVYYTLLSHYQALFKGLQADNIPGTGIDHKVHLPVKGWRLTGEPWKWRYLLLLVFSLVWGSWPVVP